MKRKKTHTQQILEAKVIHNERIDLGKLWAKKEEKQEQALTKSE